jgi:hypothetical protein
MRSPCLPFVAVAIALGLGLAGAAMAQTPPSSLIADPPAGSSGIDFGNCPSAPSPVTTGDREIERIPPAPSRSARNADDSCAERWTEGGAVWVSFASR